MRLACGRRSRVVLTPRRRRQVGGSFSTSDGDKKARSPGRARNKPLKPSRAGMPGDPGATVVTNSCAFYLCARGYGCNGHPAFPTPFVGRRFMHNSGAARGENAPGRRRPRKRAIQYSEAPVMESKCCGVLDTPLSRSMTTSFEARLFENRPDAVRSPDERIRANPLPVKSAKVRTVRKTLII